MYMLKNKLFTLSVSKPTLVNITTYKSYKLTFILRKAERDYYCDQLELNRSDIKKILESY